MSGTVDVRPARQPRLSPQRQLLGIPRLERLPAEPGCDHPWSELHAGVRNAAESSIIKSIKQSSQPKEAAEGKKKRVWAALWEINSTAFHQVEILAVDTRENEPGPVSAPSGHQPDHKVDPIGLPHRREGRGGDGGWHGGARQHARTGGRGTHSRCQPGGVSALRDSL